MAITLKSISAATRDAPIDLIMKVLGDENMMAAEIAEAIGACDSSTVCAGLSYLEECKRVERVGMTRNDRGQRVTLWRRRLQLENVGGKS